MTPAAIIAVGVILALVALAAVYLLSGRPDQAYPPAPTSRRPTRRSGSPRLVGELVFAERLGRRGIGLDCLLRPSSSFAGTGHLTPVHLSASGPSLSAARWVGGLGLREIVLSWLAEGRRVLVEVRVEPDPGTARITLRSGDAMAVLDLHQEAELAGRHERSVFDRRGS